ncbi:hypothetical protein NC653_018826 [Populus alba x Populus x berolinensis]|uniref:Uncharacterized protein n=1 Tax=Populus alba x Populus x berolinensis TaxID=444605 RepID=A0AAD6QHJ7_9ROSI|nr:hypothetical protein NC653_018826 [Populus alba x Populus x berolinensis]
MKYVNARTRTIRNQIKKIIYKKRKKKFITLKRNISHDKLSYNAKRLRLKSSKIFYRY